MFFFVLGGAISTGLNAGPFQVMRTTLGLPNWAAYAISLCFVTTVFAFWNYYINFSTQRGWKECFVRYLIAVIICAAINYSAVMPLLKLWNAQWLVIIATVQVGMGGVKFLLYHFWVYPRAPLTLPQPQIVPAGRS